MSNWYKQRVVIFFTEVPEILTDLFPIFRKGEITGEVTNLSLDNSEMDQRTIICIETDEIIIEYQKKLYLRKVDSEPFKFYRVNNFLLNNQTNAMLTRIDISIFPLVGITSIPLPIVTTWKRDFIYPKTRDVLELYKKRVIITFDPTETSKCFANLQSHLGLSESLRAWLKKVNETGKIDGVVDYVFKMSRRIDIGVECKLNNGRKCEVILKRVDNDDPDDPYNRMWLSEIRNLYRLDMDSTINITSVILPDEKALWLMNKRFKRVASRDVFTVVAKYLM